MCVMVAMVAAAATLRRLLRLHRSRSTEYSRDKVRMQADLQEGCYSEDDAECAHAAGKPEEPFALGQGGNTKHRYGDGKQGFCHIELVVEEVEVVVLFLISFRLFFYLCFFGVVV